MNPVAPLGWRVLHPEGHVAEFQVTAVHAAATVVQLPAACLGMVDDPLDVALQDPALVGTPAHLFRHQEGDAVVLLHACFSRFSLLPQNALPEEASAGISGNCQSPRRDRLR